MNLDDQRTAAILAAVIVIVVNTLFGPVLINILASQRIKRLEQRLYDYIDSLIPNPRIDGLADKPIGDDTKKLP
jgi:hypothetical protein